MKIDMSKLKSIKIDEVLGIAMAVGAGVMAIKNTLSDQRKDKEFEEMKKAVAELTKK